MDDGDPFAGLEDMLNGCGDDGGGEDNVAPAPAPAAAADDDDQFAALEAMLGM
eukprot:SAG22_NODE_429_length_10587_cov_22.842582_1_plen_53_part_00